MLMNNKFSTKNSKLYKMKCLNTRNEEYKNIENEYNEKIERFTDKSMITKKK